MNLENTIRELRAEKERLERVIASLEELQNSPISTVEIHKRRGRRFMDAAERQEVSARMKKYWAAQRANRGAGSGH